MHCIEKQKPESLKLLVHSGCSTKNLIHQTISMDKRVSFDALLDCGVFVDEIDEKSITPLNLATRVRSKYFVRSLLDHGADPSICDVLSLFFVFFF